MIQLNNIKKVFQTEEVETWALRNISLEAEARSVYPNKGLTALRTVGYKEMFVYFDGEIDKDEAIRQIQSHSREYMRKQLTWFKRDAEIHWYHPDQQDEIIRFIDEEI